MRHTYIVEYYHTSRHHNEEENLNQKVNFYLPLSLCDLL